MKGNIIYMVICPVTLIKNFDFKNENGLTLLEVIIAIAITGIVLLSVTVMYTSNHAIFFELSFENFLIRDERFIVQNLDRGITGYGNEIVDIQPNMLTINCNESNSTIIYEVTENYLIKRKDDEEIVLTSNLGSWEFSGDTSKVYANGTLKNRLAKRNISCSFLVRTGLWDYKES